MRKIMIIIGVLAAAVLVIVSATTGWAPTRWTPPPTPAVVVAPAPTVKPRITEDDWRWNCMTMGNHICGPNWHPLDHELRVVMDMSEGARSDRWLSCLTSNDGEADIVVCPDGQVAAI